MKSTRFTGVVNADLIRIVLLIILVAVAVTHYQYRKQMERKEARREQREVSQGVEGTQAIWEGGRTAQREPVNSALQSVTLDQTYTLDLETGKAGNATMPEQRDLWWQAKSANFRCLCPLYKNNVAIIRIPPEEFDTMDGKSLAILELDNAGFSHMNDGRGEVQPGLTFAVRTAEGNFAAVRVVGVTMDTVMQHHLSLQWRVFPPPPPPQGIALVRKHILENLDRARNAQHARITESIPDYLNRAVELARQLPPGDLDRITAYTEVGRIYWSIGDKQNGETWTRTAYDEMRVRLAPSLNATPEQTRIPWSVSESIYSYLGIIELDKGAAATAIAWFERAQQVTENAPETDAGDRAVKTGSILHNYLDLGRAHCRADNIDTAHEYLDRLQQGCAKLYEPRSVIACRAEPPC